MSWPSVQGRSIRVFLRGIVRRGLSARGESACFHSVSVRHCSWRTPTTVGDDWVQLLVPFEWYLPQQGTNANKVLVLWLKEEAFDDHPLQRLYFLTKQIGLPEFPAAKSNRLCVVGPRSSNTLKVLAKDTTSCPNDRPFVNWIGKVELASPEATAPDAFLWPGEDQWDPGRKHTIEFCAIPPRLKLMTNFIASDAFLATNLVTELNYRGIEVGPNGHDDIVLIAENDTLYGRSLPACFAAAYGIAGQGTNSEAWGKLLGQCLTTMPPRLHCFSYLRGLDGKTAAQTEEQAATKRPDAVKTVQQVVGAGNRAEGDSQLDYVQRLARPSPKRGIHGCL